MPQDTPNRQRIVATFARRAEGADALQVAAMVTTTMGAIESNLRPVIGRGGVAAMYRRSLLLVSAAHPWLTSSDGDRDEIDLVALQSLLAAREAAEAASAGGALLKAFCDLLASLIGDSLSERLLGNVWPDQ